jgi:hypothetical protein
MRMKDEGRRTTTRDQEISLPISSPPLPGSSGQTTYLFAILPMPHKGRCLLNGGACLVSAACCSEQAASFDAERQQDVAATCEDERKEGTVTATSGGEHAREQQKGGLLLAALSGYLVQALKWEGR